MPSRGGVDDEGNAVVCKITQSAWKPGVAVPTYYVAPKPRKGYFTSLNDVLLFAEPYSRIEVQSGKYFENVVVSKPVEISSEKGDEAAELYSHGVTLSIQADEAYVEGLSVRTGDRKRVAVQVDHGECSIVRCSMESLAVSGEACPMIEDNTIVGAGGKTHGVHISNHAGGKYRGNTIENHSWFAICIESDGGPEFLHNKIRCGEQGQVLIRGYGNSLNAKNPVFHYNRITDELPKKQSDDARSGPGGVGGGGVGGVGSFTKLAEMQVRKTGDIVRLMPGSSFIHTRSSAQLIEDEEGGSGGSGGNGGAGGGRMGSTQWDLRSAVEVTLGANPMFQHNTIVGSINNGLIIHNGGRGEFKSNYVTANQGWGIVIEDEDSAPLIINNTISGNGAGGLRVKSAQGQVSDKNEFLENRGPQILIQKGCRDFIFSRNEVRSGSRPGVVCKDQGHGRFLSNRFEQCTTTAFRVEDESDPLVKLNVFNQCNIGLLCCRSSQGKFIQNDFLNNSSACVVILTEANPLIENCRLCSSTTALLVSKKGKGRIVDCYIKENRGVQIEVSHGANPHVENCFIADGKDSGVLVTSKSKGYFTRNFLCGNAGPNMCVAETADPTVHENVFTRSHGTSISIDGGLGLFTSNVIEKAKGDGVHVTAGAYPTIRGNAIWRCKEAGLHLGEGADGVFEKNHIMQNYVANVLITGSGLPPDEPASSTTVGRAADATTAEENEEPEEEDELSRKSSGHHLFAAEAGSSSTSPPGVSPITSSPMTTSNNKKKRMPQPTISPRKGDTVADSPRKKGLYPEQPPPQDLLTPVKRTTKPPKKAVAKQSVALVRSNWIKNGFGYGVLSTAFGLAGIVGNSFENNAKGAVRAASCSVLFIISNTLEGGTDGISLGEDSRCRVFLNSISKAAGAAVLVESGARPIIAWNFIDSCEVGLRLHAGQGLVFENIVCRCCTSGIAVGQHSRSSVGFNVLFHNQIALSILSRCRAMVCGNVILENERGGVFVSGEDIQCQLDGNLIMNNALNGIQVESGTVKATNNLVLNNKHGLHIGSSRMGGGESATISPSSQAAASFSPGGNAAGTGTAPPLPHFSHNYVSCCSVGILGTDSGKAKIDNCIVGHCDIGVKTQQHGNPHVKTSVIHNCAVAGSYAEDYGCGEFVETTFLKNLVNVCSVSHATPYFHRCLLHAPSIYNAYFSDRGSGTIHRCVLTSKSEYAFSYAEEEEAETKKSGSTLSRRRSSRRSTIMGGGGGSGSGGGGGSMMDMGGRGVASDVEVSLADQSVIHVKKRLAVKIGMAGLKSLVSMCDYLLEELLKAGVLAVAPGSTLTTGGPNVESPSVAQLTSPQQSLLLNDELEELLAVPNLWDDHYSVPHYSELAVPDMMMGASSMLHNKEQKLKQPKQQIPPNRTSLDTKTGSRDTLSDNYKSSEEVKTTSSLLSLEPSALMSERSRSGIGNTLSLVEMIAKQKKDEETDREKQLFEAAEKEEQWKAVGSGRYFEYRPRVRRSAVLYPADASSSGGGPGGAFAAHRFYHAARSGSSRGAFSYFCGGVRIECEANPIIEGATIKDHTWKDVKVQNRRYHGGFVEASSPSAQAAVHSAVRATQQHGIQSSSSKSYQRRRKVASSNDSVEASLAIGEAEEEEVGILHTLEAMSELMIRCAASKAARPQSASTGSSQPPGSRSSHNLALLPSIYHTSTTGGGKQTASDDANKKSMISIIKSSNKQETSGGSLMSSLSTNPNVPVNNSSLNKRDNSEHPQEGGSRRRTGRRSLFMAHHVHLDEKEDNAKNKCPIPISAGGDGGGSNFDLDDEHQPLSLDGAPFSLNPFLPLHNLLLLASPAFYMALVQDPDVGGVDYYEKFLVRSDEENFSSEETQRECGTGVISTDCGKGILSSCHFVGNVSAVRVDYDAQLTVRFCTIKDQLGYGIHVGPYGKSIIRGNKLKANRAVQLLVSGRHAAPVISHNDISDSSSVGVQFELDAHGEMFDNRIWKMGEAGLVVTLRSSPTIRHNEIRDCGTNVSITGTGGGTFTKNVIYGAHQHGMSIQGANTHPELVQNLISENGMCGVSVAEAGCHPRLHQNEIFKNRETGLELVVGSSATVSENKFYDNFGDGVLVSSNSTGEFIRNHITGNKGSGMMILSDAQPKVLSNLIYDGLSYGVTVSGAGGTFEMNRIFGNHEDGVWVTRHSSSISSPVIFERNDFDAGNKSGIRFSHDAKGIVRFNLIGNNGYGGILCDTHSKPHIESNYIKGNSYAGIWCKSEASPVIEGNIIAKSKGTVGVGVIVEDSAAPEVNGNMICYHSKYGLHYQDGGRGNAAENQIFDCNCACVCIEGKTSTPNLVSNNLYDGDGYGVLVHEEGGGIVSATNIFGQLKAAVHVTQNAQPLFENCFMHDIIKPGVGVEDSGFSSYVNCVLYGIQTAFVFSGKHADHHGHGNESGSASAHLSRGQRHHSAVTHGTHISPEAHSATVSSCEIRECTNGIVVEGGAPKINETLLSTISKIGIQSSPGSAPRVSACKVFRSKLGLQLEGGGTVATSEVYWNNENMMILSGDATISECTIYDANGSGITIKNGEPTLLQNFIFDNNYGGVVVDGGDPTLEDNKVFFPRDDGALIVKPGLELKAPKNTFRNVTSPPWEKSTTDRQLMYNTGAKENDRNTSVFRKGLRLKDAIFTIVSHKVAKLFAPMQTLSHTPHSLLNVPLHEDVFVPFHSDEGDEEGDAEEDPWPRKGSASSDLGEGDAAKESADGKRGASDDVVDLRDLGSSEQFGVQAALEDESYKVSLLPTAEPQSDSGGGINLLRKGAHQVISGLRGRRNTTESRELHAVIPLPKAVVTSKSSKSISPTPPSSNSTKKANGKKKMLSFMQEEGQDSGLPGRQSTDALFDHAAELAVNPTMVFSETVSSEFSAGGFGFPLGNSGSGGKGSGALSTSQLVEDPFQNITQLAELSQRKEEEAIELSRQGKKPSESSLLTRRRSTSKMGGSLPFSSSADAAGKNQTSMTDADAAAMAAAAVRRQSRRTSRGMSLFHIGSLEVMEERRRSVASPVKELFRLQSFSEIARVDQQQQQQQQKHEGSGGSSKVASPTIAAAQSSSIRGVRFVDNQPEQRHGQEGTATMEKCVGGGDDDLEGSLEEEKKRIRRRTRRMTFIDGADPTEDSAKQGSSSAFLARSGSALAVEGATPSVSSLPAIQVGTAGGSSSSLPQSGTNTPARASLLLLTSAPSAVSNKRSPNQGTGPSFLAPTTSSEGLTAGGRTPSSQSLLPGGGTGRGGGSTSRLSSRSDIPPSPAPSSLTGGTTARERKKTVRISAEVSRGLGSFPEEHLAMFKNVMSTQRERVKLLLEVSYCSGGVLGTKGQQMLLSGGGGISQALGFDASMSPGQGSLNPPPLGSLVNSNPHTPQQPTSGGGSSSSAARSGRTKSVMLASGGLSGSHRRGTVKRGAKGGGSQSPALEKSMNGSSRRKSKAPRKSKA